MSVKAIHSKTPGYHSSMKRFFKILSIILLSVIGFVFLLIITAKIFQDDIAKAAVKQLSQEINTPIEIGSVDFNLVRRFPLSTIEFNDLWMKDSADIDTIAGLKHLYVSVNTRAIMNGRYEIKKVEIDGLKMHYVLNKDSISNIDFLTTLIPESTTDTTKNATENSTDTLPEAYLQMSLENLLLKNITCSYFDGTSNTGARILIPQISVKGDIMGEDYTAETSGNITITDLNFGDYNLQLMQKASLDFNLDYAGDSVNINTFSFETNGVALQLSGKTVVNEKINLEANISEGKLDLAVLSTYLPKKMLDEYGLKSAQGMLSFSSTITGEYSDSVMPQMDLNLQLQNGAFSTTKYPEIKHLSFSVAAGNGALRNNASTYINVKKLNLATAGSNLAFNSKVTNLDRLVYHFRGKGDVFIDEFKDFIPEETLKSISGRLAFELSTAGEMPTEIGDNFADYLMERTDLNLAVQELNCELDDTLSIEHFSAELAYSKNRLHVEHLAVDVPTYDVELRNSAVDVTINGSMNDMDNMACVINKLHLEWGGNSLNLQASVSNMTKPDYILAAKTSLDLADLQKFVPDTLVQSMEGKVDLQILSQGCIDLDSIETQAMALAFENTHIELDCQDVAVLMTDTLMTIADLNLSAKMQPDTIDIEHFSANYKGLDLALSDTRIINAYNTAVLNKPQQLTALTSIVLGDIDYALLAPFMQSAESEENATEKAPADSSAPPASSINYTMDIKGDLAINSLKMENYEIDSTMTIKQLNVKEMAVKFRITDSTYIADSLQFKTFGGYMNTSVRYDLKPDGHAVASMRNHIDGMDFKQLMQDMDNFGQSDLTHENISGKLLSDINAEVTLIGDSVPMDKVKMKGKFEISDGAVQDFEPVQSLSKFTGINELDNIRFQTLKTQVFVHKGAVYVPKTNIVSTALDISAFGMQSFGEDYQYHLKLHLGDVLTGKSDNLMKRQAKAAKDVGETPDRNGIPLRMKSESGKTKTSFDNKNSQRSMSNKITTRNAVLNMIFYPERIDFSTDF